LATLLANVAGTPCCCSPAFSQPGREWARPAGISKKENADRQRHAGGGDSRTDTRGGSGSEAGTLDMIAAALGDVKMPPSRPLRKISTA
jgi:hypothetical protein